MEIILCACYSRTLLCRQRPGDEVTSVLTPKTSNALDIVRRSVKMNLVLRPVIRRSESRFPRWHLENGRQRTHSRLEKRSQDGSSVEGRSCTRPADFDNVNTRPLWRVSSEDGQQGDSQIYIRLVVSCGVVLANSSCRSRSLTRIAYFRPGLKSKWRSLWV